MWNRSSCIKARCRHAIGSPWASTTRRCIMTTQGSPRSRTTGFTLVEAMVVVVLLSLISAGIFRTTSMVIRSVRVNNNIRAANNQLQQQIENIRGMDYYRIGSQPGTGVAYMNRTVTKTNDVYDATNDVLLVSRIVLADSGTVSTNGHILATMTTYAASVDDPVDGLGGADADRDTNDAMRVRAEIVWVDMGKTYTRSLETLVYGIISNDEPTDTAGVAPEDDPSFGDGDDGVVDILKAEYNKKDQKLTVEATASGKGANTLTLVGYGSMDYDSKKDKWKYDEKKQANPGANVKVTAKLGGEDIYPVKQK
ncbi:MAG: type II secretion system protein [Lentisphaerae bacterium]|nr:type II secretion system protein [Lentisphaerota bacterium]